MPVLRRAIGLLGIAVVVFALPACGNKSDGVDAPKGANTPTITPLSEPPHKASPGASAAGGGGGTAQAPGGSRAGQP